MQTLDELRTAAWIGDGCIEGSVRGVVLSFHGLGGGPKDSLNIMESAWAKSGALVVQPYYGRWAWMNPSARALVDDVVDAVYAWFAIRDDVPLIATGISMGGQASLLYPRYARRQVHGCLAYSPVCDLHYHLHERDDVPETIRHAMRGHEGDEDAWLTAHSPLCQVPCLPDIPYRLVHGDRDDQVSKVHHSDAMAAAMRARGLDTAYAEVPGMGHVGPLPSDVLEADAAFIAGLFQT